MCAMSVGPLVGLRHTPGGDLYEVSLHGVSDECQAVTVEFSEPVLADGRSIFPNVPVIDGSWDLVFNPPAPGLACGKGLTVTVKCRGDKTDPITDSPLVVDCHDVPIHCPSVETEVRVDGVCEHGKQWVTFTASVSDAAVGTRAHWDFGDNQPEEGTFSEVVTINLGSQDWETPHAYDVPGSYTARLKIEGCDDHEQPVGLLNACSSVCPNLEAKFGGYQGDCDAQGRKKAIMSVMVIDPPDGTLLQFDFQDGTFSDVFPISPAEAGRFIIRQHFYTVPGPLRARVLVISPQGCPEKWIDLVSFDDCGPGSIGCNPVPNLYHLKLLDDDGNEIPPGLCVQGERAEVVAPEHEGPVEWQLDGQPVSADANLPRRLKLQLTDNDAHTVEATVGLDACKTTRKLTVGRCPTIAPPPHPWYCRWLEAIMMISLILGIVTMLFAFCALEGGAHLGQIVGGPIGFGVFAAAFVVFQIIASQWLTFMIVFAVAAGLWYFLCKPDHCRRTEDWVWCLLWASFFCSILGTFVAQVCQDVALYVTLCGVISLVSISYLVRHRCQMPDPFSWPWMRN